MTTINQPWSTLLPAHARFGHEKTFAICLEHHRIIYSESGHRNIKHRTLRSSFFLSWQEWSESGKRVISILPIGKFYTLMPSGKVLALLLKSGKAATHEHAHTLRLDTIGELVQNEISLPMAEKYAELDLLLRVRVGKKLNTRGTALALLALFRVQLERVQHLQQTQRLPIQDGHHHRSLFNLYRVMRAQMKVVGDVLLSTFHLHCPDIIDQLRALEIYEMFGTVGVGLCEWQEAAKWWSKRYEMSSSFFGIHHEETRRSLAMVGQVYAAAGLNSDAEACLRQSLRKVCKSWLPCKSGSERRAKRERRNRRERRRETNPATNVEQQGEDQNESLNVARSQRQQQEQEQEEQDVKTLAAVYLKIKQYDHAEATLHAAMPVDPTSQSKISLSSMYLELAAGSKRAE